MLCGHVHERVEFRVTLAGEELRVHSDFYTENPARHRETWDWTRVNGAPSGDQRLIFVRVDRTAPAGGNPRETIEHDPEGAPKGTIMKSRTLPVPPYGDPLSKTEQPGAWWDKHRPLILQTACLGPLDQLQRAFIDKDKKPPEATKRRVSFQGVRLLSVEGDDIKRVSHVSMAQIRALELPDEPNGKPKLPRKGPVTSPTKPIAVQPGS